MADTKITPGTQHIKISPDAFRLWARDYFKCYLDFQSPRKFSPIPFFLCCRAIELALKGALLDKDKSHKQLKKSYSHDLVKAYRAIPHEQQTLSADALALLAAANDIYKAKDFEYFNIFDAVSAYKRFPDLEVLAALARRITGYGAPAE